MKGGEREELDKGEAEGEESDEADDEGTEGGAPAALHRGFSRAISASSLSGITSKTFPHSAVPLSCLLKCDRMLSFQLFSFLLASTFFKSSTMLLSWPYKK